jgi:predicted nucleotidyltransferase
MLTIECPDELAERLDELVQAGWVADQGQAITAALRRFLESHHPEIIEKAAKLLLEAAPAGSRVILFGSHARGDARRDSDLDFLVVEPKVADHRAEMVRLGDVLDPLGVPADVLVTTAAVFDEWRDTPGTVLYEAAREGRVFDAVH